MKKSILFMSVAVLGLSSVFLSCNKKQTQIELNNPTNHGSSGFITLSDTINDWAQAANPSNPYDSIGYLHNLGLEYIVSNVQLDELNDTTSYEKGIIFSDSIYGQTKTANLSSIYTQSDLDANLNNYANYNFNFIPIILHENDLDDTVKSHLSDLIAEITDTSYASINSYDSLKSEIVVWENSIMSSNISTTDKETLLSASSILRYSLLAWWNVTFPSDGNGYITLSFLRRAFGVFLVAASDAVSGAVGASVGGPAGAAVMGAIGSAAAAAILNEKGYFKKNK